MHHKRASFPLLFHQSPFSPLPGLSSPFDFASEGASGLSVSHACAEAPDVLIPSAFFPRPSNARTETPLCLDRENVSSRPAANASFSLSGATCGRFLPLIPSRISAGLRNDGPLFHLVSSPEVTRPWAIPSSSVWRARRSIFRESPSRKRLPQIKDFFFPFFERLLSLPLVHGTSFPKVLLPSFRIPATLEQPL